MIAAKIVVLLFTSYALENLKCQAENATNVLLPSSENITKLRINKPPVKLNMKQNLIMNQVVATYAIKSKNALCKNQSKEYQNGLRAFEPWALKMFDSSSKIQSGILAGNMMEYGSFTQCINIYTETDYGPLHGKYCLLQIKPDIKIIKKILEFRNISKMRFGKIRKTVEHSSLQWAVCVPDSCHVKDIQQHFKSAILSFTEGLDVEILLDDLDCYELSEELPFSKKEWIVLGVFTFFILMASICSIIDLATRKFGAKIKLVDIFSAYSNTEFIISHREDETNLNCLNGIRFLSICYVIIGHRYLMTLFYPAVNSLDVLEWLLDYSSTFITGGTYSVDSFFLMSGLLVSYYFFDHVSKTGKFNLFAFYIHRILRLTPTYAIAILGVGVFTHRLGSGPLWKKVSMSLQKPCEIFWWTNLLYIENYINPNYLCILQTWYLSCEMQFYILSPILLYPLWKWPVFGYINFIIIYIISVSVNFYLAWKNKYLAGSMIDNDLATSDYFTHHYIVTHVRASPYIIGIGFGYILQKIKGLKIKMNFLSLFTGWTICITLLLTIVLSNHIFQLETYEYNQFEASIYISTTRSAWAIAICWIIWCCKYGYGGPVNTLLSAHTFEVLGRITYSIFLLHMPFQYLTGGANKLPIYFSNMASLHKGFGDIGFAVLASFLLTILVEYPVARLSRLFFKMGMDLSDKKIKPDDASETKKDKNTIK